MRFSGALWFMVIMFFMWLGCRKNDVKAPVVKEDAAVVQPSISFRSAKKLAETKVYHDRRISFYCGCDYSVEKKVSLTKCGYIPRKDNVRAHRIEWEHVVPASHFGQHRKCWTACEKKSGRDCCRSNDPEFRQMEGDLMNLVPSVGELNADRSNRNFGIIEGEPRAYGSCDFEVDFKRDIVEPAESIRGDIARIYLYMYKRYPGALPLTEEQLNKFKQWDKLDPESEWEKLRRKRIYKAWSERQ